LLVTLVLNKNFRESEVLYMNTMKSVGFPISQKDNENRRCIIPKDIHSIKNKEKVFVETGYGDILNIPDKDYIRAGVNIVSTDEVLTKDIICDAKIGDAKYLNKLKNQTIFGWVHAIQNRDITDIIIKGGLTAYAWEDMFYEGRHTFWRNNEIAGESAVMHAYTLYGAFPYDTKVAVIGRGNIARGAMRVLTFMGADITVYDRKTEKLLKKEIEQYDVIVNAILWDTSRKDHIVYKEDLKRMKKGSMIIDISCDRSGAIESSVSTKVDAPVYIEEGVLHYVVDHTPSIFYKSTSVSLSKEVCGVLDFLIEGKSDNTLNESLIIKEGKIIDNRISEYQDR